MAKLLPAVVVLCLQVVNAAHHEKIYMADVPALGDSGSSGVVWIMAAGNMVHGVGKGMGLEADLVHDEATGCGSAANSCGVHIHSGTACTDSTTQGGHYFAEGETDPWVTTMYHTTTSDGDAHFHFAVDVGETADIDGKVFIIHDSTGARVACGPLMAAPMYDGAYTSATLDSLDGESATGEVHVYVPSGDMHTTGLDIIGFGTGAGLEQNLVHGMSAGQCGNATNGCGVHVHSGTACTDSTTQGGHYFAEGETDPWATIGYTSTDGSGAATFQFTATTTAKTVAAKPFVIHNVAGGRVACGLLTVPTAPTTTGGGATTAGGDATTAATAGGDATTASAAGDATTTAGGAATESSESAKMLMAPFVVLSAALSMALA